MSSASYPRSRKQPFGRGDPQRQGHNANSQTDSDNDNNSQADSDNVNNSQPDSDNANNSQPDSDNANNSQPDSDNENKSQPNSDNNINIPDATAIRIEINKLPRINPIRKSYSALLNCNKWPGTLQF